MKFAHAYWLRLLAGCLLLSPSLALPQTTWTVDLDPTAGADFLQIQPATDVAMPGDTILVGPGLYERFDLDKGVTIIGTTQGTGFGSRLTRIERLSGVSSVIFITQVPAGQTAFLVDLYCEGNTTVRDCDGVVAMDDLLGGVHIYGRADVRLRHPWGSVSTGQGEGVWLQLEEPATQAWALSYTASPSPVRMLVTHPSLLGRDAFGYTSCFSTNFFDSTPAITTQGETHLILAGRATDFVTGGESAPGSCYPLPGSPGLRMEDTGSLRWSNVQINSPDPSVAPIELDPAISVTLPATPDPSLRWTGEARPGDVIDVYIDGAPGDEVRLELGSGPTIIPSPPSAVPRLIGQGRAFPLGQIPATGTRMQSLRIPSSVAPGTTFWMQAWAVTPSGEGRRTNSIAVVIRP